MTTALKNQEKVRLQLNIEDLGRAGGALTLVGLTQQFLKEVKAGNVSELDDRLYQGLHQYSSPILDRYFGTFSIIGKEQVTLGLSFGTFLFLLRRKQFYPAWLVILATVGGWLLSKSIKPIFRRSRPASLKTLLHHSDSYSFPSGHSLLASCYYGSLVWLGFRLFKGKLGKLGWTFFMLYIILMIGGSRFYRKEHYPSDVLAGYLIGVTWLLILLTGGGVIQRLAVDSPADNRA